MRSRIVRNLFRGVRAQIKNIKLLRPSAGIALPRAEIAEQRRVHDFLSIRRKIAPPDFGIGSACGIPPSTLTV